MSRTVKSKVRRPWSHEATWAKRQTMRKWKAKVRQADRMGAHDDAPRKLGTCGWVTW